MNTTSQTPFDSKQLSAGAEEALGAIEQAGNQAEGLVKAWLSRENAAAIAEVADSGKGAARKAARRALNVLKSRGITVPERRRVARLVAPTEEVLEAWMLPPDPAGVELFGICARVPNGRARACFVYLHREQGIARVDRQSLSQSQLKDYFKKVLPGAGYGAVRVPVDWARTRIADARKAHRDRGAPEPLGFSTASDLLEPLPKSPPQHPFDAEGLALSDDDATELAKNSGGLHNLPEFRGWLPTRAAMQELLVKLGERLAAEVPQGQEPPPEKMSEFMKVEVEESTDRYFTPQMRELIVALMKDSALSVLERAGEQTALEVAATMNVVQRAGLITDPPREIPFLRAFFEKALGAMAAQEGGRLRIPVPRAAGATAPQAEAPVEAGAPVPEAGAADAEASALTAEASTGATAESPQPVVAPASMPPAPTDEVDEGWAADEPSEDPK